MWRRDRMTVNVYCCWSIAIFGPAKNLPLFGQITRSRILLLCYLMMLVTIISMCYHLPHYDTYLEYSCCASCVVSFLRFSKNVFLCILLFSLIFIVVGPWQSLTRPRNSLSLPASVFLWESQYVWMGWLWRERRFWGLDKCGYRRREES